MKHFATVRSHRFIHALTAMLALALLASLAVAQQIPSRVNAEEITQDRPESLLNQRGQRLREPAGAVYVMSNAVAGNEIHVFLRDTNGYLTAAGVYSTDGIGTGGSLGNQAGLVQSADQRWLLAVNAGSNSIAVFEIQAFGLRHRGTFPSGGMRPVSLTIHDSELVYAVNASSDSIAGFKLDDHGELTMIANSVQQLSGANTQPAQIAFDAHAELLFVTEKTTNLISVYEVDANGVAGMRKTIASAGQTPFGFSFGFRNQLFVSEAFGGASGGGALTSYKLEEGNALRVISRSVGSRQTAACWAALTPDGHFAFVTNTGSDTISSYRVKFDGSLELAEAIAANSGDGPIDLAISADGRFLYVNNRNGGSIGAYRLNANGRLSPIPGGVDELPASINGMVAR
jgi:6-phosphogluconolactonase